MCLALTSVLYWYKLSHGGDAVQEVASVSELPFLQYLFLYIVHSKP